MCISHPATCRVIIVHEHIYSLGEYSNCGLFRLSCLLSEEALRERQKEVELETHWEGVAADMLSEAVIY